MNAELRIKNWNFEHGVNCVLAVGTWNLELIQKNCTSWISDRRWNSVVGWIRKTRLSLCR